MSPINLTCTKMGKSHDVIVVGGGPAGIAAALAAKRAKKNVLLVEKGVALGGLATLGLVVLYNPPLDDGKGRKLIGGLSEELLHCSIKYGYHTLSPQWRWEGETGISENGRYQTLFSAPAFSLAAMELLEKEGVEILYNTSFLSAVMDGKSCRGVLLATKAGIWFYPGKAVVDATGDGDVFASVGAACEENDENWLTYWALSTSLRDMKTAIEKKDVRYAIKIEGLGAKANGENQPEGALQYGIRTPEEVSDFVKAGQKLALERLKRMGKSEACFIALPSMPQYRKTRRIRGLYTLEEKDRGIHFDDSIGCTAEEWNSQCLLELPFRMLISIDCDNILAAGRLVSAKGVPMDTIRLIGISALTGEAAGTAAAILTENSKKAADLDVVQVQKMMKANGNILHF